MKLTKEQVDKFKEIHKKHGCFENLTDKQIEKVATGIAGYYSTLYKIHRKNYNLSGNISSYKK